MTNRTLIALLSTAFLVLSGCALSGSYEINGESGLSLDRAIALATSHSTGKSTANYTTTTADLWYLWKQAPTQEKIVIEEEILKAILQGSYAYGERNDDAHRSEDLYAYGIRDERLRNLRSKAYSEEVKKAVDDVLLQDQLARQAQAAEDKRKQKARQLEERKRAEDIRFTLQESRKRLIREAGGTLGDKSAEEVKRLVDEWRQDGSGGRRWSLEREEYARFFGAGDFYKAFGQPQRKQLISGDGVFGSDHYYFYYQCRDGTVQMRIDAEPLSKENLVLVSELNVL